MTNNEYGMFNTKRISEKITVGNGKTIEATKVGKIKGVIQQQDGTTRNVIFDKVKFVPGLWCKLFSLPHALEQGFELGNKNQVVTLKKGNFILKFDHIMKTGLSYVGVVCT